MADTRNWIFISIGTCLVDSITYLYLPLIPDLALCRDKVGDVSKIKQWLYDKRSMN
jgi:molybdopterin-containing oxidoreductase family membrane subunit